MDNIKKELGCMSTYKIHLEIISIINLHLYKHLNIKVAPVEVCKKQKKNHI